MDTLKPIKSALISVYHKEGLDSILSKLNALGVELISTGGTKDFIEKVGYKCKSVESLTSYPSIFGGRVKTLHPKVFGGILQRRDNESDNQEATDYTIPEIDLVIVDLYPFEATVAAGASQEDIIEKIDIGGISLIRAGAKNFNDVVIVASQAQYAPLDKLLGEQSGATTLAQRLWFASEAFKVSSGYDSAIYNYMSGVVQPVPDALRVAVDHRRELRYGENPHQQGNFYGNFDELFTQLHGKEISYNNILDIDAAASLIADFSPEKPCIAIIKHNNACGLAVRSTVLDAWTDALAGDPVSAFGGVIASNALIDDATAEEINKIFFEVIIAPGYTEKALAILEQKKNRIILHQHKPLKADRQFRSALNGALVQARDNSVETPDMLKQVTERAPLPEQIEDLLFANIIVKHSKSNAIVLAKGQQLLASGVGQTSRVDALRQAIEKAHSFGFDLSGSVMASDAFFPFADCVEIADKAGVVAVIHPGGSIRDNDSVQFCNEHNMAMVTTGIRHFKH